MVQPFDSRTRFTNPDGTLTDYALRLLQDRGILQDDAEAAIAANTAGIAQINATQIIAGNGLDGGGAIGAGNITIDADTQEILDAITSTQGSILYRGAAAWGALAPGTEGQFLKTNGAGADPSWDAAAGGSGSLTKIAQFLATGSETTTTFSSIPSTYDDLIVIVRGRGSVSSNDVTVNLRFNGDTGSNYDDQRLFASNTTVSAFRSSAQTSAIAGQIPAANSAANVFDGFSLEIPGYKLTTGNKSSFSVGSNQDGVIGNIRSLTTAQHWRSTAAINSVTLFLGGGNFVAGSTITLYGRGG